MTDLARVLWCGAFGARGDSDSGGRSDALASSESKCDKAREPRPPAETRRNERRLSAKSELVHIKKGVARQQHLAEVGPNAGGRVRLLPINDGLFLDEAF